MRKRMWVNLTSDKPQQNKNKSATYYSIGIIKTPWQCIHSYTSVTSVTVNALIIDIQEMVLPK